MVHQLKMCDFIGKVLIQIEQNTFCCNYVFALRILKVEVRERFFNLYLDTHIKELPLIKFTF